MMHVTARRDANGIFSLSAEGHTGYAERGSDIVCASVSVLMQALQVGLQDVLNIDNLEVESEPLMPRMAFSWNSQNEEGQIIAETVFQSLAAVANSYPDFVTVTEEEI